MSGLKKQTKPWEFSLGMFVGTVLQYEKDSLQEIGKQESKELYAQIYVQTYAQMCAHLCIFPYRLCQIVLDNCTVSYSK